MDPKLSLQFVLDGIITVVDAKHIMQHLDEVKPEGTAGPFSSLFCAANKS
jgi:G3E family GTPase